MALEQEVNILIVDDKPRNIFALENMLARPGRTFHHAINGNEALKMVLKQDISLIILDVHMPDMDGFEVAKIIKSSKRTEDIPIIFASAEMKSRKSMMKGFDEGAIDYLYKPLDRDITEAKVAVLLKLYLQRKELLQKNLILERYALLINNSADIICIINSTSLAFEEINDAVNPTLGYEPNAVRGTSLLRYISEEDHPVVKKFLKDPQEKFSLETRVYTKDRAIKWFHWNIINKKGRWFANARDITEKKEVEEIKNYLAAVVKQSTDAIYLHNPEGKIISWNHGAEVNYGFTESEALNMKVWNIVPNFLLEEAQELINRLLKGEQIQSLETKRITKFGKIIDVVFSASLITDAEGVLKSVAITERDITLQKIAEQEINLLNDHLQKNVVQLESMNNELESFSHSVSHDLRAPLRAINGYANIIQEEFHGEMDEELHRLFQIIKNNSKRMGQLIDGLLDFSKLGRKEIRKSSLDLKSMVLQIVDEMQGQIKPNAKITVQDLGFAEGDYTLIYQCYVNLISNAVKYSSKKAEPAILIGSREAEKETIYFIQDNGSGFNMEYVQKLFGVFQRLHKDEEFEGTGVGLGIVKRIIAKHGGKVWAEGEPGVGATFYFSLPKTNQEWTQPN